MKKKGPLSKKLRKNNAKRKRKVFLKKKLKLSDKNTGKSIFNQKSPRKKKNLPTGLDILKQQDNDFKRSISEMTIPNNEEGEAALAKEYIAVAIKNGYFESLKKECLNSGPDISIDEEMRGYAKFCNFIGKSASRGGKRKTKRKRRRKRKKRKSRKKNK